MKNKFVEMLKKEIKNSDWTGYVTYYPHKKAYKTLEKLNMKDVWKDATALNLYVHIPFCDRKCSYCNLFSTVLNIEKKQAMCEQYVEKLLAEIDYYSDKIDKNIKVMSLYFGGGTPNILSIEQYKRIIDKFKSTFNNWDKDIEVCSECSPDRLTLEYMKGLKEVGIDRISVGVQSFIQAELNAVQRYTKVEDIEKIREWAREVGLNINFDLIYGLPYQTDETIMFNTKKVLELSPESICMYPLAIRKHTGLDNIDKNIIFSNQKKYEIYETIRKMLETSGYICQTIVRFIKSEKSTYQQQRYEYLGIPTLGVGCGARSYTDLLSYCMTYKVQDRLVRKVIEEYLCYDINNVQFDGFVYDEDELKRKYIMLNLLDPEINKQNYYKKFGSNVVDDFKDEIDALKSLKLVGETDSSIILTRKGRQYCDIAVDIFVSEKVRKLYSEYVAE